MPNLDLYRVYLDLDLGFIHVSGEFDLGYLGLDI